MKNKTVKSIFAVTGYLWGGALLTLLVSLAVTIPFRMAAEGGRAEESLTVGLAALAVQLLFAYFCFSRYGYRNPELAGKNWTANLFGGAGVHFLLCLPFHFSMYTAGVPVLYLAEYFYQVNTPGLPSEFAFTEIPLAWLIPVFSIVEGLVLLCAHVGFSRGQKKRGKEREALKTDTEKSA